MSPVEIDIVVANIKSLNDKYLARSTGSTITFDGFYKIYKENSDDQNDDNHNMLPILEENENLDLLNTWSKNDLLIGTLKDNSLIHVKLAADRVILVEKVYLGARIRDITSNNRVVFISTDDGRVLTLTPGSIITPSGPFPDIYPKENYLYSNIPGIRPFVSWVDKMLQDLARLI
jgi:hypothetical protein